MSYTADEYYRLAKDEATYIHGRQTDIGYLQIVLGTLEEEKEQYPLHFYKQERRRILRRMRKHERNLRKAHKRQVKWISKFSKMSGKEKRQWAPFSTRTNSDESQ
jgi:hypothetical protein